MSVWFSSTLVILAIIFGALSIFTYSDQISWAAFIVCPTGAATCNGTANSDVIQGTTSNAVIHGLGGNDYIIGYQSGPNFILGDDGDDIMIGGTSNDFINGGRGNDKYDGNLGDDTLIEAGPIFNGALVLSGDDIMSGGYGNDYLMGGEGADKLHGGPGNDYIHGNSFYRDFSKDYVDCGSGSFDAAYIYSGDGDVANINCEGLQDYDG